MLAFLPQDSILRVLDQPLEPHTPHTITEPDVLLQELESIREQGFAVDNQGVIQHLTTVAAPIFALGDKPVAALAMGGPSHLFNKKRVYKISRSLLAATHRLSQDLHHQPIPEAVLP